MPTAGSPAASGADSLRGAMGVGARHLALAVVVMVLAWLSLAILGPGKVAPIWPANGVLLAVLLRADQGRWAGWLLAGLVGIVVGGVANGGAFATTLALALCDMVEVAASALAIQIFAGRPPDLSRLRAVITAGIAAMISPLISASGAAVVLGWLGRPDVINSAVIWVLANGLGQMIAAPTVLALTSPAGRRAHTFADRAWTVLAVGALLATVLAVFGQNRHGLIYLVFAPLVAVVFRSEVRGAAFGVMACALLATVFTVSGYGPLAHEQTDPALRIILLQVFLLATVLVSFPVAAALADRRRALRDAEVQEARMRFLSDHSRDVVARLSFDAHDPDKRRVLDVSTSCRTFGYEPDELIGRRGRDLIHPDDQPTLDGLLRRLAGQPPGGAGETLEWRLRRRDGGWFWIEGRAALTRGADGDPLELVLVMRDITERRAAAQALAAAEAEARARMEELARVSRALSVGEFASSIAHEINQPIAAIVTNGEASLRWLSADPPNLAEARLAIGRTIRDASRAAGIVSRTRTLLSKSPGVAMDLDINACIEEVLLFTDAELRRNDVEVRKRLAVTPPRVRGDRIQLQQVLLNLIRNSIEAMVDNEDRPRVLTIATTANDNGEAVVLVSDTGHGLDAAALPRVFDSFFTTKTEGVGLGLPISRSIVESHGGRMWATSSETGGATFQFTLPPADGG